MLGLLEAILLHSAGGKTACRRLLLQDLPLAPGPTATAPAAIVLAAAEVQLSAALATISAAEQALLAAVEIVAGGSSSAAAGAASNSNGNGNGCSSAEVPLVGPKSRQVGQLQVSVRFQQPGSSVLRHLELLAAACAASEAARQRCDAAEHAAAQLQQHAKAEGRRAEQLAARLEGAKAAAARWQAAEPLAQIAAGHDRVVELVGLVSSSTEALLAETAAEAVLGNGALGSARLPDLQGEFGRPCPVRAAFDSMMPARKR